MSVPKIKGIETEWCVIVRGKDYYKSASTQEFDLMINTIRKFFELPLIHEKSFFSEIENIERISSGGNLVSEIDADLLEIYQSLAEDLKPEETEIHSGAMPLRHHNLLTNGSRFYIDGPHIEYSTPECLSAKTLVVADKAGEAILNLARISVNKILAKNGLELIIYKDNSDRKGHSYGCHENYLLSRQAFQKLIESSVSAQAAFLMSYFVARQIFTGAGKMGIEVDGELEDGAIYQISQRADFMKELISGCTTMHRAFINLRDEPHADKKRFARLHVIVGDANMSEFAAYLKVGVTSIILKMIEDGFFEGDLALKDPICALKSVSLDLTCKKAVLETAGGRKLSSLALNFEFLELAKKYLSQVNEASEEEKDIIRKWEETLTDFSQGNEERLSRRLDWKIKKKIFDNFLEAHGFTWKNLKDAEIQDGSRVVMVVNQLLRKDLLYHDINKDQGLYWFHKKAGETEEILTREEIIALVKEPPKDCRSYFRGKCLEKFYSQIDYVDWGEIVFCRDENKNYTNFGISSFSPKIELGNPAWGSKKDVGELLQSVSTFKELLDKLSGLETQF